MRKYIWIIALAAIAVFISCLLWGWSARLDKTQEDCAMANTKAGLFQKAIGEFGALTPEEAALLWGKGVQERNGALQYAVMSDELKKVYKEAMDQNSPSWVTGVSSPWVEKFEIIESKKTSKEEYQITLQFSLATAAGSEGKHLTKLYIYKEGQYWAINNVEADEIMLGLSGLSFLEGK